MNGWISVDFALPAARYQLYLVWVDHYGVACARFYRHKNGKIKWCTPFGGCNIDPKSVTHWMQLPSIESIENE